MMELNKEIEKFTEANKCSKEELLEKFGKKICKDIRKYTKKFALPYWERVNWKKRNNKKLNYFEQKFYDNISFAINNFTLNQECTVYRGFATTVDDLKSRGIMNDNGEVIIGKEIHFSGLTSTSLELRVAELYSAKSQLKNPQNDILLIYKISVKENETGIPIYMLAKKINEFEVLFNNSLLKIKNYYYQQKYDDNFLIIETVML